MTEQVVQRSIVYEHCDVPQGVCLSEWRAQQARSARRAKVAGGVFAAVATFAPVVMSVRGTRSH